MGHVFVPVEIPPAVHTREDFASPTLVLVVFLDLVLLERSAARVACEEHHLASCAVPNSDASEHGGGGGDERIIIRTHVCADNAHSAGDERLLSLMAC